MSTGRGAESHPDDHDLQGREASVAGQQQQAAQHVAVADQDDAHRQAARVAPEHQETQRANKVSERVERCVFTHVSSPLDRSKRFTLHPTGTPVRSATLQLRTKTIHSYFHRRL